MPATQGPQLDVAFEQLIQQLGPKTKAVLARHRIPAEDGEDLLQQTLLTFLYKRQQIRCPEAWVLGALKKKCLVYWRNRRRCVYEGVDNAILESLADTNVPAQERYNFLHDLTGVLATLPSRCRSLLSLRYRQGYNPTETAKHLGYKPSSIYKLTERCLASLTTRLVACGLLEERQVD